MKKTKKVAMKVSSGGSVGNGILSVPKINKKHQKSKPV